MRHEMPMEFNVVPEGRSLGFLPDVGETNDQAKTNMPEGDKQYTSHTGADENRGSTHAYGLRNGIKSYEH